MTERETMLKAFMAAVMGLFGLCALGAGSAAETTLPDILPQDVVACVVPADDQALEHAYSNSVFRRMADMPEMAAFFRAIDESRRLAAQDLVGNSGVSQGIASEILDARIGGALLAVNIDRDGRPSPEFLVVMQLRTAPDRRMIFDAVGALLNRREIVRAALESQGLDPDIPIKTLAQEETLPGYPPMLRIGPRIRVTVLGRMVVIYYGPGSEGIKTVFDAAQGAIPSLAGSRTYQTAVRECGAAPGMAFTFVNVPRLLTLLDAAGLGWATRIADALGLSSAQAFGMAGGYQKSGMRHNLYFHMPGQRTGLLSTILPMPPGSPDGMEIYSQIVPSPAEAFLALRLDLPAFVEEAPYFAEAVGAIVRPGGMGGYLSNETLLGVPLREFAAVLGEDLVIRPHEDTQIALFANIDVAAFEHLVARMEQNSGTRFRALDVGGFSVRYFNQLADASLPLAPSFCLIPKQQPAGKGVLYLASHPQALASLIHEATAAGAPLSQSEDYLKAVEGLDGTYSLFHYVDCRGSYRRFYNFMLPIASLWASSGSYAVDTGLLPPASSVTPDLFGCAFGVKRGQDGLTVQAYSPVGVNALFILLADKLVISNPLTLSYVHSWIREWSGSIAW